MALPEVQQACLEIAHCFVSHAYPRVLNNNANLVGVEWDVAPWLVQHFSPYLRLAGVEQVAWVHASSVRGRNLAEYALSRLSTQVTVALFGELEDAVSWLQSTRPEHSSGCALLPRQASTNSKLMKVVQAFEHELEATKAVPANSEL